jgi:carbamoyl-phosphate synthase large subunit
MSHSPELRILVTGVGGPAGANATKLLAALPGHLRPSLIVGVDIDPLSAGRRFCDEFRVISPVLPDPEKLGHDLRSIIGELGVTAVLPTVGEELPLIRGLLDQTGVEVVLSPDKSCAMCDDKLGFYRTAQAALPNLVAPFAFETAAPVPGDPLFVKPRRGRGSRGCRRISRREAEALEAAKLLGETIVMEDLPGEEFTVDAYARRDGSLSFVVPRRRLGMTGGISTRGETVRSDEIESAARQIFGLAPWRGPICLQLKRDRAGAVKIVELNPRLSGAATITAASGANPMESLCAELRDLPPPSQDDWREIRVARHFEDTIYVA